MCEISLHLGLSSRLRQIYDLNTLRDEKLETELAAKLWRMLK